MPRVAVSGHRNLPDGTVHLVDKAIRAALSEGAAKVTGLSCLADRADQIFARAVLDLGRDIEAVIPAEKYRDGLPAQARAEYDRLLAKAVAVHRLPFTESTSEAHMAGSKLLISRANELYAVWDGRPAHGYGGTADVVAYTRERDIPVLVIWPDSAQRG
jgi:hypothetical protein